MSPARRSSLWRTCSPSPTDSSSNNSSYTTIPNKSKSNNSQRLSNNSTLNRHLLVILASLTSSTNSRSTSSLLTMKLLRPTLRRPMQRWPRQLSSPQTQIRLEMDLLDSQSVVLVFWAPELSLLTRCSPRPFTSSRSGSPFSGSRSNIFSNNMS